MCLTIPKKVIAVDGGLATLETVDGKRQIVKTMVELGVGDYVLTQQNIAMQKIGEKEALEILELIKG